MSHLESVLSEPSLGFCSLPSDVGEPELSCFENCKAALANQLCLHHRDDTNRLCVYTDASDHIWSGIVTQVPFDDLSKAHVSHRHEPLAFLSGRFSDREYRWSILEKEAFAILATLDRMHWVVAALCGFDLYTDHNNLIFPDLSQSSLKKVLRWAVCMSSYNYTHGTQPNDLLQFDFLEIAPIKSGAKYLLMLCDDFSSYSWLIPFTAANSENTADPSSSG